MDANAGATIALTASSITGGTVQTDAKSGATPGGEIDSSGTSSILSAQVNNQGTLDVENGTLTLLSEMGLIDEQLAEGARKLFAITPEGTAHLAEHEAEVVAMLARLDALGAMRERTDAVPIRRAMHNLRSVLMSRLGEGLDKERMHEAVALIDEAARKIERL